MFRFSAYILLAALALTRALFIDNFKGEKCLSFYGMNYKYQNWYNASEFVDATNTTMLLKFYVQTASNAHIMLSTNPWSIGYEIVLGAGSNTFSDLRKPSPLSSVMSVETDKILDKNKPLGFWIRVSQSGMIEVGKDGESLPFMFWADPNPIPVKYFSFSSYDAVVAKWMFKCQPDTNSTVGKTDYTRKFLTNTERLRKDVLKKQNSPSNNPTTKGVELLNVALTSNFKFIHLDVMTSTLTLRGYATFEWNDRNIRWNPKDYKNISKLHLSHYELWQPELVLHNALDPATGIFSEAKISVDNDGKVLWRPKFEVKTKCNINLKQWPWDQHKCTLTLSTWSHKISNVFYEIKGNEKPECFEIGHSDWKLDKMTGSYVEENTPWDDIVASINNDNPGEPKQVSLQLEIEISRNTKILEKLFFVPLMLISVLWLSSFCLMPNSASKITVISVSVIISTSVIVYMTKYVPVYVEYPPNLLIVYLKLMLLMSTDAFISSILITVHSRKKSGHPSFVLTRFLTMPFVTKLLILPKLEPLPNDNYNQMDENSEEYEAITTLWDIVVVAVERILFVTYCTTTIILLSSISIF